MRTTIWMYAAVALGCGAAASDQERTGTMGGAPVVPTTRTEGTITIREHGADAFARAPQLTADPTPLATMGAADADPNYDLTWAHHVTILDDGRVLALAPVGNRIMLFGPDGRGLWTYGRTGKGPGDLMAPGGLVPGAGDTVYIPDTNNRRINRLIPGTGIVGQSPLTIDRRWHPNHMAGVLSDGMFVLHSAGIFGGGPERTDTTTRTRTPLLLVDDSTGAMREVAMLPDLDLRPLETRFRGRKRVEPYPVRLGRHTQIVVWDTTIAVGTGDGYRIDLYNRDGQVVTQISVPVPRRPVTDVIRDAQIARELERFEAQQGERMVDPEESRRLIYDRPIADSLPPYESFFVTRSHTLWVVDPVAPGDTSWSATAFDRDGAILGRLTVAGQTRPLAFSDDRVVVRGEDADGVVFLRVLRIRKPTEAPMKG